MYLDFATFHCSSKLFRLLFINRVEISINYKTDPEATALQWLTPEQTAGGKHPYLFSQCQVSLHDYAIQRSELKFVTMYYIWGVGCILHKLDNIILILVVVL